jgi:hypothetical protein
MLVRSTFIAALLIARSSAAAQAAEQPAPPEQPVRVGGFIDVEWRVMGIGGHVSHGPAFSAGVSFADGRLRIGLAGFGRPGPWNPATFDVTLADGETYRGQSTLSLRSDGSMLGLHIAGAFEAKRIPWLAVSIPLTVGYGGFGFYLHDADRNTPDGRLVSEWENELFDGRDSHLGVVIDMGIRLGLVLRKTRYVRPYIGLMLTVVPGFDTVVRQDYFGFSGALGVEVGYGL